MSKYSYKADERVVEVNISSCKYLYIMIDQKEGALRVHKKKEEDNVWNEIRVRRKNDALTKFDYEIGIYTEGEEQLYFNFSREFKEKEDVNYSYLKEDEILNY